MGPYRFERAIGALLKLLDFVLCFRENLAAVLDERHALFVLADRFFQPDLTLLNLLGDGFELVERLFERCFFLGQRRGEV